MKSSKWVRRSLGSVAALALFGGTGAGCLSRPVTTYPVDTKTNFTAEVRQQAVDKVDLLFAIDNSRSMADKQDLLAQAVPDLMKRLVTPNCVDDQGNVTGTTSDGTCTTGKAEFQPVHDLHIGIVSSALGGRGSDACSPDEKDTGNVNKIHNDDQAHLLVRATAAETDSPDASPNNGFLAWYPDTPKNVGHTPPTRPVTDAGKLGNDFADMVIGVKEFGCGFEAQLESWYRFLVQPDPYATIERPANSTKASLNGIDTTIIQQRHDFLRPDSLVAIIMLTDENDSTVDPLAVGGQGWAYENSTFPGSKTGGGAARGTSQCDAPAGKETGPNDPKCTSCGFNQTPDDPNCQKSGGYYDLNTEDPLNERFFHMKQRFGVDPQFPIQRYINALTNPKVPDRNGEHPGGSANYAGQTNCINPLFATNLPTSADASDGDKLCNLTKGPRGKELIYFAVIGGVPWQLLLKDPSDPAHSEFATDVSDKWISILGNDPLNYDFGGADPHMIESIEVRPGLAPPTSSDTADAYNGREWDTNKADLQYACTFQLPKPRDCSLPQFTNACDCNAGRKVNPPLCASATSTQQVRGKAYPTIREFSVVRAIAAQGIIASLCPRSLDLNNADYGYRPAVRVIVDRLKNALANQCLPQALTADPATNEVPCLILLTLENTPGGEELCDPAQGLTVPDPAILAKFREQAEADFKANGGDAAGLKDPALYPVCELKQLVVAAGDSCAEEADSGWCYVQKANGKNPAGETCSQAILFTAAGNKVGAKISLQCIEKSSVTDVKGDGG